MTKITTYCILGKGYDNLKLIDLSEFRSLNVFPIIEELTDYFNKNLNLISSETENLLVPVDTIPTSLKGSDYLMEEENNNLLIPFETGNIQNNNIKNIVVMFEESYDYAELDEYNIDNDVFNNYDDYQNIEECFMEKQDCSYIENYAYYIHLEIYVE